MRIVAGDAADSGIGAVEALAIGQPIRLEAHVGLASPVAAYDRLPGAMAFSAEIRQVLGREASQLRRHCTQIAFEHAGIMRARADVAMFAGDSWFRDSEVDLVIDDGPGCVAAEA